MKFKFILSIILYSCLAYADNLIGNESMVGLTKLTVSEYFNDTLKLKNVFLFDTLGRETEITIYNQNNSIYKKSRKIYEGDCLSQIIAIDQNHDTTLSKYEYKNHKDFVSILTKVNGKNAYKETIVAKKYCKLEYFENPIMSEETRYDSNGNANWELKQGDGNSITCFIHNEYDTSNNLIKSTRISYETSEAKQSTLLSVTNYKYQKGKITDELTNASDSKVINHKKYYYNKSNRIAKIEFVKEFGKFNETYRTIVYQYN